MPEEGSRCRCGRAGTTGARGMQKKGCALFKSHPFNNTKPETRQTPAIRIFKVFS